MKPIMMHSVTNVTATSSCILELWLHIRCLHTCGSCEILGARPLLREPLLALEQSNGTAVWAVWQSVSCSPLHFFLDPRLGTGMSSSEQTNCILRSVNPLGRWSHAASRSCFWRLIMDGAWRWTLIGGSSRCCVSWCPFVQVDTLDGDYNPPDTRSASTVHTDVKADARNSQTSPWKTQILKSFVTSLSLALIRRVLREITLS